MARISLTPPRTVFFRVMEWYSRRTYGKVLDPGKAMAHSPRVLWSYLRFEQSVAKWHKLDKQLGRLAVLVTAGTIGCSWCMDFGFWESHHGGMDPRKLRDVPMWRDSDAYTDLERDVMAYAEAMTATPPAVDDDLSGRLRRALGDPALVELTMLISVENLRSRTNTALGLSSQGFKESCDLGDAPGRGTPVSEGGRPSRHP